ncbi:MAG: DUF188 domain-containing protein [Solirubrobacterales bacterium]|nr:DUF188 domain-containing protein [Solirubrobacterales bacterium]
MTWLVDGMNVIGARPDGWWRDRTAAMARLVAELDAFARRTGGEVAVVLDGRLRDVGTPERVAVAFAPVADDALAARARPGDVVVTSDAALAERARAAGAAVEGAGAFRRRMDSA